VVLYSYQKVVGQESNNFNQNRVRDFMEVKLFDCWRYTEKSKMPCMSPKTHIQQNLSSESRITFLMFMKCIPLTASLSRFVVPEMLALKI